MYSKFIPFSFCSSLSLSLSSFESLREEAKTSNTQGDKQHYYSCRNICWCILSSASSLVQFTGMMMLSLYLTTTTIIHNIASLVAVEMLNVEKRVKWVYSFVFSVWIFLFGKMKKRKWNCSSNQTNHASQANKKKRKKAYICVIFVFQLFRVGLFYGDSQNE